MKSYILTDHEKQIMNTFINQNMKLEGFYYTVHLARKLDVTQITKDLELIKEFLEKAGTA